MVHGGYSAGTAEWVTNGYQIVNGIQNNAPAMNASKCTGGSYFSEHTYDMKLITTENSPTARATGGKIGGEGSGVWDWQGSNVGNLYKDAGGGGWIAGKGGTVRVSKNAKIYAFNGNKYTDGTSYNGGRNQCPIYAQNGVLRDVYIMNSWWGMKEYYNYDFFYSLFGSTIASGVNTVSKATGQSSMTNVLVRAQRIDATLKTDYINPVTGDCYGVGSGAGYIELSNGSYLVDTTGRMD